MTIIYRSRAPLRVSFSGGGTDLPPYCIEHGGQVTRTTIDKFVHITVNFNNSKDIIIHAYNLNEDGKIAIGDYCYNGKFDLIKAVLKHFDIQIGCEIFIHSDLPAGSGMGTSSALVVALISLFATYLNKKMTKAEIADLACKLERHECKQTGGYQDQYAASFGGFNYITFRDTITVQPIKISQDYLNELNYRMILCYAGKNHFSAEVQQIVLANYEKIDFQEGMEKLKCYADDLRDLLIQNDISQINKFGDILHKTWIAKQQLSKNISTDMVDRFYLHSMKHGALGGKLLGAGGGGFILFFTEPLKRVTLIRNLEYIGGEIIDFHLETTGVMSWRVI